MKTPSLALAFAFLAACSSSQEQPHTPTDAVAPAAASPTPPEPNPPAPAAAASAETPAATPAAAASEAAVEHVALGYLFPEASEGQAQSPINIVSARAAAGKHKIKFHYKTSKEHVDNLGHTVKVTYDAGSSLDYDGHSYDLLQFHFHTPSEHLLDGVTHPMEMHLVHSEHDHPEHLLVVGVLFKEGAGSALLGKLLSDVPAHAGEHADKDTPLDVSSVCKAAEGYYHYEGSLTTPPYSETVTWLVVDKAHDASAEQIEALSLLEGNNARHVQDQHARLLEHWH